MEGFLLNRNQTHWKIILSSLEVELCSAQSLFIAAVVIVGLGSDPLYYDLLLRCTRRQQGRSKTTDLMVRKIAQDERSKPKTFLAVLWENNDVKPKTIIVWEGNLRRHINKIYIWNWMLLPLETELYDAIRDWNSKNRNELFNQYLPRRCFPDSWRSLI